MLLDFGMNNREQIETSTFEYSRKMLTHVSTTTEVVKLTYHKKLTHECLIENNWRNERAIWMFLLTNVKST